MVNDRSYHFGPVRTTRHHVDWANSGPTFSDFALSTYRRIEAMPQGTADHYYFNPAFTVTAPSTVPEETFLALANRACGL